MIREDEVAMLILSRRVGESLIIGDDVVVTVLNISSGNIRIGVSAPREVAVFREEIYQRIAAGLDHDGQKPSPATVRKRRRSRLSLGSRGQKV